MNSQRMWNKLSAKSWSSTWRLTQQVGPWTKPQNRDCRLWKLACRRSRIRMASSFNGSLKLAIACRQRRKPSRKRMTPWTSTNRKSPHWDHRFTVPCTPWRRISLRKWPPALISRCNAWRLCWKSVDTPSDYVIVDPGLGIPGLQNMDRPHQVPTYNLAASLQLCISPDSASSFCPALHRQLGYLGRPRSWVGGWR